MIVKYIVSTILHKYCKMLFVHISMIILSLFVDISIMILRMPTPVHMVGVCQRTVGVVQGERTQDELLGVLP